MRFVVIALFSMLATVAALAHDDTSGLMGCYDANPWHCHQDSLVVGVVIAEDATTCTLAVQKRLIGPWQFSNRIRLQKHSLYYVQCEKKPAPPGTTLAVTYLSTDQQPFKVHYAVRSSVADWRQFTVDSSWRTGDQPMIEAFIRSGAPGVSPWFWMLSRRMLVIWASLIALLGVGLLVWRLRRRRVVATTFAHRKQPA
jgi:hypothetical protein